MNFINKKANNEKVLDFVLRLGRSFRAKKAPKLSSEYLNFPAKFLTYRKYLANTLIFMRQKYH